MQYIFVDTRCDLSDSDFHSKRRMENDNNRYSRQNSCEDHLRNQSLHDYSNFYTTHNRCYKGKKIFLS